MKKFFSRGKIPNSELSPSTQGVIDRILDHSSFIRFYTGLSTAGAAEAGALGGTIFHFTFSSGIVESFGVGVLGTAGIAAISTPGLVDGMKSHNETYSKEELDFFRVLEAEYRKGGKIKEFLDRSKYLAITNKGDIVRKRFNPRIKYIPIGRRRTPSPANPRAKKILRKSPYNRQGRQRRR